MQVLVVVLLVAGSLGCGRMNFDPLGGDGGMGSSGDTASGDGSTTPRFLYAATQSAFFRIDPVTLTRTQLMPLCANLGSPQLADIAMSSTRQIVAGGLASTAFYRVATDGTCTLVTNQPVRMFALEFIPAGVLGSSEVLIGAGDDAMLYRVDPQTGGTQLIGLIGSLPGGDLTWTGTEALLTTQAAATDHLARLNLTTGAATDLGDTTYDSVTGLAWFDGALYGFVNAGTIFELDAATGAPIRTQATTELWAGATTGE